MDNNNQTLQNVQDAFLNTIRRDRINVTIYLIGGVKLTGKIRSFDKFSVVLESGGLEQLIFKHAISTISVPRGSMHHQHQGAHQGSHSSSSSSSSAASGSGAPPAAPAVSGGSAPQS
jgi:host factor-I protein